MLYVAHHGELEVDVAGRIVVDRAQQLQRDRAAACAVERLVKAPVQRAPVLEIPRFRSFLYDHLRPREIHFSHARDRGAEQPGLQLHPDAEQFLDLTWRQGRHHGALVELGRDEAFGFEVADRFAEGDTRDTEFGGQTLLAQRHAFSELPSEDAATQLIGDLLGQRHAPLCDLRHIGYDIEASRSFNTIFSAGFPCDSLFFGLYFRSSPALA